MITTSKPITKIINLTLNGFHGYQSHSVRASFAAHEDGYAVSITESAAAKFRCRSSDCRCGEHMPTEFTCDEWDFDHAEVTVRGNYPQR